MGILAKLNPSGHAQTRAAHLLGGIGNTLPAVAMKALDVAFGRISDSTMKQVLIEDMNQLWGSGLADAAGAWKDFPDESPVARATFAAQMLAQSNQGVQRPRVAL